jgi:hypothetical protein
MACVLLCFLGFAKLAPPKDSELHEPACMYDISDDKALLFINTIMNKSFRLWCGPRYKQEKSKRTEQRDLRLASYTELFVLTLGADFKGKSSRNIFTKLFTRQDIDKSDKGRGERTHAPAIAAGEGKSDNSRYWSF